MPNDMRHFHPHGRQHGSVPWYVPEGAEFDSMIEYDDHRRERALYRSFVIHVKDNPWYLARENLTTLEDVGVHAEEESVDWEEVEDWEDLIPPRPRLHPVQQEFDEVIGFFTPPPTAAQTERELRLEYFIDSLFDRSLTKKERRQIRVALAKDIPRTDRIIEIFG